MAISKEKKQELLKSYIADLKDADKVVVIKQNGIGVSIATDIRKEIKRSDTKYNVVKKRIFKIALKDAGYEDVDLDKLDGSVIVLYTKEDEHTPLKIINTYIKKFEKDEDSKSSFDFLGAWFDKKRQDGESITELANMPSRDELLTKLAWLFNYPLQSFAGVLNQIAEKSEEGTTPRNTAGGQEVKSEKEEVKEEIKEEVKEEVKEEAKEETPVEEPKEEAKE